MANGNLNRVETVILLKKAVKRLVENPDAELKNLGRACDSANRILADREKESGRHSRHGYPQLNLLIKLGEQDIYAEWFKQQLREFHLALDYELAATAPLDSMTLSVKEVIGV